MSCVVKMLKYKKPNKHPLFDTRMKYKISKHFIVMAKLILNQSK